MCLHYNRQGEGNTLSKWSMSKLRFVMVPRSDVNPFFSSASKRFLYLSE